MRLQLVIDCPQQDHSLDYTAKLPDALYEFIYKRTTEDKNWENPYLNIKVDGKFYVTEIKGPEPQACLPNTYTIPVITARLIGDIDLIDDDGAVIYRIR